MSVNIFRIIEDVCFQLVCAVYQSTQQSLTDSVTSWYYIIMNWLLVR